jgi:hypothetical protein
MVDSLSLFFENDYGLRLYFEETTSHHNVILISFKRLRLHDFIHIGCERKRKISHDLFKSVPYLSSSK